MHDNEKRSNPISKKCVFNEDMDYLKIGPNWEFGENTHKAVAHQPNKNIDEEEIE